MQYSLDDEVEFCADEHDESKKRGDGGMDNGSQSLLQTQTHPGVP